jgi:hypothetical protein
VGEKKLGSETLSHIGGREKVKRISKAINRALGISFFHGLLA